VLGFEWVSRDDHILENHNTDNEYTLGEATFVELYDNNGKQ
jgi:hypothetical protein